MAFISLQERTAQNITATATSDFLGPGAYSEPKKVIGTLSERVQLLRQNASPLPGFGSNSPMLASGLVGKFTPGPGFYNNAKANGAFNKEYINPANANDAQSPTRNDDNNGMFYFVI